MNWIGDFVDLSGLDKRALIHNFTLSTAEVEDIIVKGEDTFGVVVAKILSVENHPTSKKLHLLKVDTGKDVLDIVCGAPNVREGMKVALATAGGSVAGHAITPAEIAGFKSYGMCCSMAELGLSDDNSGIWEIEDDIALGTDIKSVYGIDDVIFEVDNKSLTNRPDLWSHYGIAREFATITGRELKKPTLADLSVYDNLPAVEVDVKATDLVRRYSAIKLENIKRAKSPIDMQIRLFYCGSRAINFLADLTNYVMLEIGQPMHAFDSRKVDKIEVQTFDEGFDFVTLDGVSRKIDDKMLMITSGNKPVAIAGVMGGDSSKIEDGTNSLLLESATFDGVSVRKTTTRLGLRTDASMRYEKMLDPELCRTASERLVWLLLELDGEAKVVSSFTDKYVNPYPLITLEFDKKYVDRYTGIDIPTDRIITTLRGLGFVLEVSGESFRATVPTWRATKDVTIKADIIEEITRIYGYDNFDIYTSLGALLPVREERAKSFEDRMKDMLVKSYRMHEVHSYIWNDEAKCRELGITPGGTMRIINAQTPDHQYIRRTMMPTLFSFTRENRGYADDFGIFEIGHVVDGVTEDGRCNEQKKLGAVLYSRTKSEEELFLLAADAVRELASDMLHKSPEFALSANPESFAHPKNCFDVKIDGVTVGYLAVLHPTVLGAIDKKCAVAFFEIFLKSFAALEVRPIKYAEPSRFPAIDIDLTFTCDVGEADFAKISEAAYASSSLLADCRARDVYTDELGVSALTLRFSFVSRERTLSKQELQPETDAITASLAGLGLALKI